MISDERLIRVSFYDLTQEKLLTDEVKSKLRNLLKESLTNYPDNQHLLGDYGVYLFQGGALYISYPDGLVISDQLEEFLV